MTTCARIWTLSGAIGGGTVGLARAASEPTAWGAAGELGLSALLHGVLGAALGALLALLAIALVKLLRARPDPATQLRAAAIVTPAIALLIVLKTALG